MNKFLKQNGYYIDVSYLTADKIKINIGKAFTRTKNNESYGIESGSDGFTRLFKLSDNERKQISIVENYGQNIVDLCVEKLLSALEQKTNINPRSYLKINR